MEDQDRGEPSTLPPTLAAFSPVPDVATESQVKRLFDLPDELWLRIGKMVIDDEPAINVRAIKTTLSGSEELRGDTTRSSTLTPPAILQTCAALRKELRNGYYRDKITVSTGYVIGAPAYQTLGLYLRMIGSEAREHIRVSTRGAERRRGIGKGRLFRPPSGFNYWEWELMFTPTQGLATYTMAKDREPAEWEITFL